MTGPSPPMLIVAASSTVAIPPPTISGATTTGDGGAFAGLLALMTPPGAPSQRMEGEPSADDTATDGQADAETGKDLPDIASLLPGAPIIMPLPVDTPAPADATATMTVADAPSAAVALPTTAGATVATAVPMPLAVTAPATPPAITAVTAVTATSTLSITEAINAVAETAARSAVAARPRGSADAPTAPDIVPVPSRFATADTPSPRPALRADLAGTASLTALSIAAVPDRAVREPVSSPAMPGSAGDTATPPAVTALVPAGSRPDSAPLADLAMRPVPAPTVAGAGRPDEGTPAAAPATSAQMMRAPDGKAMPVPDGAPVTPGAGRAVAGAAVTTPRTARATPTPPATIPIDPRAAAPGIQAAARPAATIPGRPAPLATVARDDDKAGIAGLSPAPSLVPAVITAPEATTPLDMTRPQWPAAMIERIEHVREALNAADTRIRLVPDALGSIDLSVKTDGDTVHVHFNADQASTRAMIAEAQPRLAEIAEQRGLKLGQTSVSGDTGGAAQHGGEQRRQPPQQPFTPSRPVSARTMADDAGPGRDDARIA